MNDVTVFDTSSTSKRGSTPSSPKSIVTEDLLTCVDLFAGAGGLSLAARNIGWHVAAAVEFNCHAAETYKNNLIDPVASSPVATKLYENDIAELAPQTLLREVQSLENGCDVLLGGPPCQGFSTHRINDAGVGDPRNELILRYFDFVEALKPKFFLIENVPGILWTRHREFKDELYRLGRNAGYVMEEPVQIDARDFGVPQRRKRVFILGVRNDFEVSVSWPPPKTHGSDRECEDDQLLKEWVPASRVFEKNIECDDPNNLHMNHTDALIEVFKSTPLNGGSRSQSNRVLPCHKGHDGHKDVYGRIDPSKPGPTMTTACINPSKGRFVHPTEHHGITVRHAARFQTFPDSFIFSGGLTAAGQQIGNAVPIKLGEALLKHLEPLAKSKATD